MATDLHVSTDGAQWTPATGLQRGLPSVGAIRPSINDSDGDDRVYDCIVIGAGYTGLVAARDLTKGGVDTLLVEARDRIGGRTWSSTIDGHQYDLGGTWVHWNQPFIWRELARYGMTEALEVSPARGYGFDSTTVVRSNGASTMSHAEEFTLLNSAFRKLVNVDGQFGRALMPFPHHAFTVAEAAKYDKMSIADRLQEIGDDLLPLELELLQTFLSITTGGPMEDSGFFELLRWWALNNYDLQQLNDLCLTFRLRQGQSRLARNIFDDAMSTGRLSYRFSAPLKAVVDEGDFVRVETRDGLRRKARRVISTIPLNVLHAVEWQPPLIPGKREAAHLGHVNHLTKVHVEVNNPGLRTFSAYRWKGPLSYIFGDSFTPAGNTHLVSFGCSLPGSLLKLNENEGRDVLAAAKAFSPSHFRDIRRLVYHDWNEDEFSNGAWEFLRPEMSTKYLKDLRKRHGKVFFASADWSNGWRGFIDGGVQDGVETAQQVIAELLQSPPSRQSARL